MTLSIENHIHLENCAIRMKDAAVFLRAIGSLIDNLTSRGLGEELLDEMVMEGLSAGLRITGESLHEGASLAREQLKKAQVEHVAPSVGGVQ